MAKLQENKRFSPVLPMAFFPRCSYAFAVTSLPLGVRCIKPSCIKKGSYTSSSVPASSPTAVAMVVMPTGPPLNFSMMVERIRLSISSNPCSSTFNAFNACCVMPRSISPSFNTCAKSLTLLNKPLAIRGVPRLRLLISPMASFEMMCSKLLKNAE